MTYPNNIDEAYLSEHPECIFVFGDNELRRGYGGAAHLRWLPNTYGFVTKKAPNNEYEAFYNETTYAPIYEREIARLRCVARSRPTNTFLISRVGAGLANRLGIWEAIIKPKMKRDLADLANVVFLW